MTTVLNPLQTADWDRRIHHLPGAGFFHSAAWARVLAETYGYRPQYFITGSALQPESVLALMEVSSWVTGRRGISLPFTDDCAPCASSPTVFEQLWNDVRQHGSQRGWKHVELRGGGEFLPGVAPSVSYYGHRLSLSASPSSLLQGFHPAVRQAIRKAERSGVQVEFSASAESLQQFYRLYCQTRKRHGAPPQPYAFFEQIRAQVLVPGSGHLAVASQRGRTVAAAIFFHFGSSAMYKFGASDEECQSLRANNLVMWRAIERYANDGFTSFDFGRTSLSNAGLRRFKLSWGVTEHPVRYYRYDLLRQRHVATEDRASGWQAPVFHAMPAPLFRLIGSATYRHIA